MKHFIRIRKRNANSIDSTLVSAADVAWIKPEGGTPPYGQMMMRDGTVHTIHTDDLMEMIDEMETVVVTATPTLPRALMLSLNPEDETDCFVNRFTIVAWKIVQQIRCEPIFIDADYKFDSVGYSGQIWAFERSDGKIETTDGIIYADENEWVEPALKALRDAFAWKAKWAEMTARNTAKETEP